MSSFSVRVARWLLAGLLGAQVATAAPLTYSFTTGDQPFASSGAPVFAPGTFVSGTFTYDSSVAASGTDAVGSTLYEGSFGSLVGSVGGEVFSDALGTTAVGDGVLSGASTTPVDLFAFRSDPRQGEAGVRNLVGFTIGGMELFNIRFFWIEGLLGIPDFVVGQALLASPPTFEGRLALDFVPVGNPSGTQETVFFDGLFVSLTSVPEPTTLALLMLSLPLLRWLGLARRRSPA